MHPDASIAGSRGRILDDAACDEVARCLLTAYKTGEPIEPLVSTYGPFTLSDAYRVQQLQVAAWQSSGRTIQGHKVGLTSAVMQRQLGISEPDFGVLRDDMFLGQEQAIALGAFLAPRVEPEIAFVLSSDLAGPGVTTAQAEAAVDHVLPALEIIDSRIRDWRISLSDTIADNASSGAVVLGDTPVALDASGLADVRCDFFRNEHLVATGRGEDVLGSPLNSLVWLANALGAQGTGLRAGQTVLTGSLTAAESIRPCETWTARFLGLGSVSATFGGIHE